MKKTQKLSFVLLVAMLVLAMIPVTAFAQEEDMILVYAQTPEDWTGVCLWAWDTEGKGAFEAWPGGKMTADKNNPGWSYCYVPKTMVNVIINGNEGSVQTKDSAIEPKNVWLTIEGKDDGFVANISYDQMTQGDLPEYIPTYCVYAKAPDDWKDVSLWAWSAPDGTNLFASWPGQIMNTTADGWYSFNVPEWVNSVIINGNAGSIQTSDLSVEAKDVWVVVKDDKTADIYYEKPTLEEETFTVHAKAPEDWIGVSLWAWSHPDGTNVFVNWPGEELEETDGWYTYDLPVWVNSIIINGNAGTVQTADISIEAKDLWLVVTAADKYELFYEEPVLTETPATPEPQKPSVEPTVEATPEPVAEKAEPANDMTWLWILAGGVVVLGVIIVIVIRKKSK